MRGTSGEGHPAGVSGRRTVGEVSLMGRVSIRFTVGLIEDKVQDCESYLL